MKEVKALNCGRENELIAFLYGELKDDESRTFQSHARSCAACSLELTSLQDVRESVVAWRDESLGRVPAQIAEPAPTLRVDKPSAVAALREFFNLSPLWMKGALAFASILFCLFAGLAIASLRDQPPTVIVAHPSNSSASEEQLRALVQRRVEEELNRIKNSPETRPDPVVVAQGAGHRDAVGRTGGLHVASNTIKKARRPLSKTEREQLAADLRLVAVKSDGELDLLDDGINQ